MSTGKLSTVGWPDFRNGNSQQVPPFGIMRVTGTTILSDGRVCLLTDQPNSYGDTGSCMVNGPAPVAGYDGTTYSYGVCNRSGMVLAQYDPADGDPANGDMWGPRNATWLLKKYTGGLSCMGAPTNTTQNLALFSPLPMTSCKVKTIGTHSKGVRQFCDIWSGLEGSETAVGAGTVQFNCYNRFANLGANKWARAAINFDTGNWELVDGEC